MLQGVEDEQGPPATASATQKATVEAKMLSNEPSQNQPETVPMNHGLYFIYGRISPKEFGDSLFFLKLQLRILVPGCLILDFDGF